MPVLFPHTTRSLAGDRSRWPWLVPAALWLLLALWIAWATLARLPIYAVSASATIAQEQLAVAQFTPQEALGRIEVGQPALLRLEGFDPLRSRTIPATVQRIDQQASDGLVRVELALREAPAGVPLLTGLRASVEIEVEQMAGHRTRLAQQPAERWHADEDALLARYAARSQLLDRTAPLLSALIPRGWLVISILALLPGVAAGTAEAAAVALGVGGALLGYRALRRLATALTLITGAAIAWRSVEPLFRAGAQPAPLGSGAEPDDNSAPLLDAHGLRYAHAGHGAPTLADCDLQIAAGERVLLHGPSGGGKSTLAALLTGLRQPDSGLLLLGGFDYRTLGAAGWRRRIIAAPQFHENHIFTGTLAFNLLLGRRWPADAQDEQDARALCSELGLGPLLQRMPSGLQQLLGENGWQLSHGERGRLALARALLSGASLIVLDESFAALDPETLQQVLRCVLDRAPTVLISPSID